MGRTTLQRSSSTPKAIALKLFANQQLSFVYGVA